VYRSNKHEASPPATVSRQMARRSSAGSTSTKQRRRGIEGEQLTKTHILEESRRAVEINGGAVQVWRRLEVDAAHVTVFKRRKFM
jgi:hypothetical protein